MTQRTLEQLLQEAAEVLFAGLDDYPEMTVNTADCMGDTPLHLYLWRGDQWAVHFLLTQGANPNALGDMGETPLHVAVRNASPETIAALLRAGAREDLVSEFAQTPLQLAQLINRETAYREAQAIHRSLKAESRLR